MQLQWLAALALLAACDGVAGESAEPSSQLLQGQARANLYQCEGCEGAFERNATELDWRADIGPGTDIGEPLTLEGQVLSAGSRQPTAGVIIYAYQTNADGLYAHGTGRTEAARRHGRLRGWVRTGADGRYRFNTIKPAPYPNDTIPAHVHFSVLEPGRRPYWIDDIVFAGEFGVTDSYRRAMVNQGGSGIVSLTRDPGGRLTAQRDIILERHPEAQ